jgi:hypothetical protein
MKNKVAWLVFSLLMVSAMLLASCGSSSNSSTTAATTNANASTVIVTYGSVTRTYAMADMQTLLTYFGYGGPRSQSGTVNNPPEYLYTAIALTDVIKGSKNAPGVEPGGLTAGQSVKITGADGYSVTFTYDQIMNGNFPTYSISGSPTTPAPTTATIPVIAILYWANGNGLDTSTGPFELGICYGQPLLTDANYWVKMVYKIDVIPAS